MRGKGLTKEQVTRAKSIEGWRAIYGGAPLEAFLERIRPSTLSEEDGLRFLAEWNGDVEVAAKKHAAMLEWRTTYLPVTYAQVVETLRTHQVVVHGFDRVGRPIIYYRSHLHDPRAFTPEQTVRAMVYVYEDVQRRARTEKGFPGVTDEVCVVIDRSSSSRKNMDVEFLKQFYALFKECYPARCETFLIYPSNIVFNAVWALVRPFLDAKNQCSTYFCRHFSDLLDFIEEDQIADFLGGKLVYDPPPYPDPVDGGSDEEVKEEPVAAAGIAASR